MVEAVGHADPADALTGLEWLSIVRPEVRNKAVVKSFFYFKLNFFIFLWVRDLYKFENFSIISYLQLYL